jgi:NAD(P)-dependent dehydrogenase (short-subunit alcohol dehydrogenase family)
MENLEKLFDIRNRIAVVTGGYGHLGKGLVRTLLSLDAIVIVAGRSGEKYIANFTEQEQSRLTFKHLDITSTESIDSCFLSIDREFGRVDILINNAFASRGNSQENLSDEDWTYTFEGVVGSVHKTIRSVTPIMKRQKSGKIINISSMYGIVSPNFKRLYMEDNCEKYTNPPHYGAAKAAIIQLTRYYAVLLGPSNIHVNSISPGPFPNKTIQEENSLFIEKLKDLNPLNKIGRPEDLAGIVALLSSSASDFITGQNIQVDGGWTIW